MVPGDQIVPLPEQDDTHINRSLVLNFMLRFNSVLDPEKLKFSLDTLLSQPGWRKIGARLRLNVRGGTFKPVSVSRYLRVALRW